MDVNKQSLYYHWSQFTTIVIFNYAILIIVPQGIRSKQINFPFFVDFLTIFLLMRKRGLKECIAQRWQSKVNNKCQYLSWNFVIENCFFFSVSIPLRISKLDHLALYGIMGRKAMNSDFDLITKFISFAINQFFWRLIVHLFMLLFGKFQNVPRDRNFPHFDRDIHKRSKSFFSRQYILLMNEKIFLCSIFFVENLKVIRVTREFSSFIIKEL